MTVLLLYRIFTITFAKLLYLKMKAVGFWGFMVFHGFWLVSMVFQGGFMVFHSFWLVSMVFQGGFMVFGRFPWLMVPGWLNPS